MTYRTDIDEALENIETPQWMTFGPFLWIAKMILMFNIQDQLDAMSDMRTAILRRRAERERLERLDLPAFALPCDYAKTPCPVSQKMHLAYRGIVSTFGLCRRRARHISRASRAARRRHMGVVHACRVTAFNPGRSDDLLVPD